MNEQFLPPAQKAVYIMGHRNPDTDSVVAAAAYARLKRCMGKPEYAAVRGGKLAPQTEYIFERFKVPVPQYIPDMIPKVAYYMNAGAQPVSGGASLWNAVAQMAASNAKALPVVNADGTYSSLLNYNAFAQNMLKVLNPETPTLFSASVRLLRETLSAQQVLAFGEEELFKCVVIVAAASFETFKATLALHTPENAVVITADRGDVQEYSIQRGVRALVLSVGTPMEKPLREKAALRRVSVLISPYPSAETAMLAMHSAPVSTMADSEIKPAHVWDTIRSVRPLLQESASRTLPVVDDKNQLVGTISESNLLRDPHVEIILVDHNEITQALEGIENYRIREIIDHHRLGNLNTKEPISFINRPVGATCTIIVSLYRQNRVPIPKEIASILLAGILADTLLLQSSTTTAEDRDTAEYLSNITDLDVQEFGREIIAAANRIGDRSAGEVIKQDMKEYDEAGVTFTVSQIEVDTPAEILSRKKEFLDELEIERRTRDALFSAIMVTDITKLTSTLLIAGKPAFLESLGFPRQGEGVYFLNDILSRKKQLVPLLTEQVGRASGA
ncbi:putative manganese-dependent inorganic diphosphatase [Treponema endosymbiont of Eucomonympha sp.]|uniref:putative manganese-dependent inorganic diphosphatase n=1 Tax=Treponema endosymbiont of Eucomonympha sp. TaxID=1580831 RepID=UPI00078023D7|nr:putative manganese-dependent inorganic diphosphatase [Treponema endosymbiont of Eucomonympha sp.]